MTICPHCSFENPRVLKSYSPYPFSIFNCSSCEQIIYQLICSCGNAILSKDRLFFGKILYCETCTKHFNLFPCPKCEKINFWNGDYLMGTSIITCFGCKNVFQQIACPHCFESNYWNQDQKMFYDLGAEVKCFKCQEKFHHLNCPTCSKPVYFNKSMSGKYFECPHCENSFAHVRCCVCRHDKYFKKEENFEFGRNYLCKKCNLWYVVFECSGCSKIKSSLVTESQLQNKILYFFCDNAVCAPQFSLYYMFDCILCRRKVTAKLNLGCSIVVCESCKNENGVFQCTECKTCSFCSCSIKNDKKHCCLTCKKQAELTEIIKLNLRKSKEESNTKLCLGDYENPIETVFVPCGHACYCFKCYDEKLKFDLLLKCPICRQRPEKVIKFYFSV